MLAATLRGHSTPGLLNNYVDKMRGGGGGQKMSVFVHAQGIKTVGIGQAELWKWKPLLQ